MSDTATAVAPRKAFETGRQDAWWLGPLVTAAVLLAFVAYVTFRQFEDAIFGTGNGALDHHVTTYAVHGVKYLSPFFSPDLYAWFGMARIPFISAAVLILWAPAGFRMTCYYYRKAYYRSLFQNPPGCAVNSPWPWYKGERYLLLFQNLHRYALYAALVILVVLWWDFLEGCIWAVDKADLSKGRTFGVGLGTIVLFLNAFFLSLYTFSCHCWRHLVGGGLNCFVNKDGTPTARYQIWKRVSFLNERHQLFAWISLIWVGFTDVYITCVERGIFPVVRII